VLYCQLSEKSFEFIMATHLHFSANCGVTKEGSRVVFNRTYPLKSCADNP